MALWARRTGDPHGDRVDTGLLESGAAEVVAALRGLPDRPALVGGKLRPPCWLIANGRDPMEHFRESIARRRSRDSPPERSA